MQNRPEPRSWVTPPAGYKWNGIALDDANATAPYGPAGADGKRRRERYTPGASLTSIDGATPMNAIRQCGKYWYDMRTSKRIVNDKGTDMKLSALQDAEALGLETHGTLPNGTCVIGIGGAALNQEQVCMMIPPPAAVAIVQTARWLAQASRPELFV